MPHASTEALTIKKSIFDEQLLNRGFITEEMVGRDNRTMKDTKVPSEVTAFTSASIQENMREDH